MPAESKIYAVIDTNVIVSSMFSRDGLSNPAVVLSSIIKGAITPLYNDEILAEYKNVLSRPRFPFSKEHINAVLSCRYFLITA